MGSDENIYTILFIVLAAVIFFRLRGVLGERTGFEKPPEPSNPRAENESEQDNVVPMPGVKKPQRQIIKDEVDLRPFAKEGTPLFSALEDFIARQPEFHPAEFLENAKQAYEMIVLAFAKGDKKLLADLLAPEVLEGFIEAIDERAERDEILHTDFIGFDSAKFVAFEIEDNEANATIRFESNLISMTKNATGAVVDGDASDVVSIIDYWTFSKDLQSGNPVWYLVSTEYEQA
jgi:predicted lipid-binding transport protein (Tim44 family)